MDWKRQDRHTKATACGTVLPVAQLGEGWEAGRVRRGKPVGRDAAQEWCREDPGRARCTEGGQRRVRPLLQARREVGG